MAQGAMSQAALGPRPWRGGEEKKRGWMHSPPPALPSRQLLRQVRGIAGENIHRPRVSGPGRRCFLPTPTLGKVPTLLAPASKPTVITPFSANPILFLQGSSVTSGSQSLPHALLP